MDPASRSAPGGRVLQVFFDVGHEWPLWERGTGEYAMEPSDYGFSEELVALLIRWREAWMRVPITGADDGREPGDDEVAVARALRRQAIAVIRREVPPDVEVRAD